MKTKYTIILHLNKYINLPPIVYLAEPYIGCPYPCPCPCPPIPMGFGWAWVRCSCSWVGMGGHGCDIIVHGQAWVGIGFVHRSLHTLQIGVKFLGCREYANQEAFRAKANNSERPFICPIQPRLSVGGYCTLHNF
jgi:hypothetical protein